MGVFVFDFDTMRALELIQQGHTLSCPRCKSELWVKDGSGRGSSLPVHAGIHCPTDPKHVTVLFNLASVRERMSAVFPRREDPDDVEEMGAEAKPTPK